MAGGSGRGGRALGGLVVLVGAIAVIAWWVAGDTEQGAERPAPLQHGRPTAEVTGFTSAGEAGAPSEQAPAELPKPIAAPPQPLSTSAELPAPWARLIGRVVRPDGTPVGGVNVIHPLLPGVNLAGQLRAAPPRTGSDGSFQIAIQPAADNAAASLMLLDGPPASRVLVHVPAPKAGDTDLGDLVLADGAGLAGRIVDPEGVPLARVHVTVRSPDDHPELFDGNPDDVTWQNLVASFTFDDGRFLLTGLPDARMDLFVNAKGFEELTLHNLAPPTGALTDLGDLALSEGRVLHGVLLDADGAPVANRQVMAQAERSFPRGTLETRSDLGSKSGIGLTDEQGRFRIGGLQPGVYELAAWTDGHAFTRLHDVADDRRDVVLRLRRAGRVLLTLRDGRTRAPVADAQVEASMAPKAGYSSNAAYAVSAGLDVGLSEGLYVVDGCGEDSMLISVSREGYSSAVATIEGVGPGEQRDLAIDLAPSVVLSGVVQDQFEQPVAGAVVQAGANSGPAAGSPTRGQRPGADGIFRFEDLAVGSWQIWAYAPGHGKADNYAVEIPPEGMSDVIVRLPVLGRAEGLVAAGDGTAIPGSQVVAALVRAAELRGKPPRAGHLVIASENTPKTTGTATCDDAGHFELDELWPGTWLLAAALESSPEAQARLSSLAAAEAAALGAPGSAPVQPLAPLGADVRRVTILDGEATHVDLSMPVPAQLAGRALSDGRPLAGARVVLGALNGDNAAVIASTETDAVGAFSFTQVTPGSCVVVVFSADEIAPRGKRLELHDGDHAFVEVSFHGPTLRGVVVNKANREAVGDVSVTGYAVDLLEAGGIGLAGLGKMAFNVLRSAGTQSRPFRADAKGRFEIPHLPPGRWRFFAEGGMWLTAGQVGVELRDDWTPKPIEVPVQAGAIVQGSIRYAFGGGWPPDVEVQLYSQERQGSVKHAYPDDGHYVLDGVLPGAYEVRLRDMQPGQNAPYVVSRPITLTAGEVATVDLLYEDS